MERLNGIRSHITNGSSLGDVSQKDICAIIGISPSTSARSPKVWNYAFGQLEMDATFLSFDVPETENNESLRRVVSAIKTEDAIRGIAVTNPYKQKVIPLLDGVDEKARKIGAVNFIRRMEDGSLHGYNTDGMGGLASLLDVTPGKIPLMNTLKGNNVLMYGAGGAARALAFYFAEAIGSNGKLYVANRNASTASSLCASLNSFAQSNFGAHNSFVAVPLHEEEPYRMARLNKLDVGLVVNASNKGQKGSLENYSALYSANPLIGDDEATVRSNERDLSINLLASEDLISWLPTEVPFFDAVHTPAQSRMLTQATVYRHRVLNGKPMNVLQAAKAFGIIYSGVDKNKVLDLMHNTP